MVCFFFLPSNYERVMSAFPVIPGPIRRWPRIFRGNTMKIPVHTRSGPHTQVCLAWFCATGRFRPPQPPRTTATMDLFWASTPGAHHPTKQPALPPTRSLVVSAQLGAFSGRSLPLAANLLVAFLYSNRLTRSDGYLSFFFFRSLFFFPLESLSGAISPPNSLAC